MFVYPIVSDNQRTDVIDWNRLATGGLSNLAKAVSGAFLRQPGSLIRGGKVKPNTPASKHVIVEPLIGVDASGNLLLQQAEVTLAVPNNVSGNPRIDLVSVGQVVTDRAPEMRTFWNESTEVDFDQDTVAEREVAGVPVLTVGTPSGSPVAPVLPAGHIALATVNVAAGFTAITDAEIERISAAGPLHVTAWQGDTVGIVPLPLTVSDHVLRVSTPSGMLTLLLAQAHVISTNGFSAGNWHKPLVVELEEVGVGVVARAAYQIVQGGHATVTVGCVLAGPKSPGTYRLKFSQATNQSGVAWGGINLPSGIDGVDFPTTNFIAAVTL